jgi:hypothetical protein
MTDTEQILLILAALTFAFAHLWVRQGSVVIVSQWGERPSLCTIHRSSLIRNAHGGLILGNLCPLGGSFAGSSFPFCMSPDGLLGVTPTSPTIDDLPDDTGLYVRFDELTSITLDGRRILANRQPMAVCDSATVASSYVAIIRDVQSLATADRAARIDAMIADRLDFAAARQAYQSAMRGTRNVRVMATLFAMYCFGMLGSAVAGHPAPYEYAIPGYFIQIGVVFVLAARAARRMGIAVHAMILFSPVDAFRAADSVLRTVMAPFHPWAVLHAVGRTDVAEEFERQVIRDARFPRPMCLHADPAGRTTLQWFREAFRKQIGSATAERWATAITPPVPQEDAQSYCPRCECQFEMAAVECSCGITSLPFVSQTPP